ncbi:MAG: DNA alkylation repair protein [Spirochaetaceae bacterium]|jgi:3-methyladenine DNA glycosylase AlkC|nr:DNA alkylation repair protein [Spirochaetaceae bacterium]
MAKKFKDYYNADCAKLLAGKVQPFYPDFPANAYRKYVEKNIDDKPFSARVNVFADAFEQYLPKDYSFNIRLFENILGPPLQQETGMFTEGWWLWPVGRYLERHACEDAALSLSFIEQLTQRFTGEYAIRPLLENKTKETIKTMLKWSKSDNVHVRRLSSEGVRIALPWAKKTYAGLTDFASYKKILGNLRNDTSRFVQKSVGNNLNDLYKEFPEKAKEIIAEWEAEVPTKECAWIIKHGLRSIHK